ncbi:hypothetical protein BCR37DRAFT_125355 [Protomyces lactucae-debilis]|uniref:Uncharacterized protein n=1 Tax=Protomyces lactucae-debilis TaxID=2754530 RepID=A0A1Y2FU36_PROLT|nr:uncharacterized protein BCR37DRAFT_125355 [Protomyces lactucae-debilis]ORY86814.1 hypothetical protein BCR37DRAFT_125355 [Protomyces lactucae-debilis]
MPKTITVLTAAFWRTPGDLGQPENGKSGASNINQPGNKKRHGNHKREAGYGPGGPGGRTFIHKRNEKVISPDALGTGRSEAHGQQVEKHSTPDSTLQKRDASARAMEGAAYCTRVANQELYTSARPVLLLVLQDADHSSTSAMNKLSRQMHMAQGAAKHMANRSSNTALLIRRYRNVMPALETPAMEGAAY